METCVYCGHPIFLVEIDDGTKSESFWYSDSVPLCDSPDQEHLPKGDGMSNTIDDVDKAEMMLSLGMNEAGEALSAEERATLEQFVATNKPNEPELISAGGIEPSTGPIPEESATGIAALVQAEIAKALGGGGVQAQSFEDVLKRVDPRDSEAALAMFNWLADNGRFGIVGQLNGGGYLLHYTEPKGTSKAGYSPGATQGGRMVDQAVQKAKDAGAKPRQTGMCDQCWSAVEKRDDGSVVTDGTDDSVCPSGGAHTFNG